MRDIYLHIDLILAALIGREDGPVESLVAEAERGVDQFLIIELALYCALCSVQIEDRPNFGRLCRLLRYARIVPSPHPFEVPSAEEIAHWREVALNT